MPSSATTAATLTQGSARAVSLAELTVLHPSKTTPAQRQKQLIRQYASARNTRTTLGFGSYSNTSADSELAYGLVQLRARSRQMLRDSCYAKRARTIVVNNVVGSGVGMQAQVMTTRDKQAERINTAIEAAWADWCSGSNCHSGGKLHFADLERLAMGEVFTAGEVFLRKHYAKFGASRVPLALEVIEAERLANELVDPGTFQSDADIRLGVEVDQFQRPLAYWIRNSHQGDIRPGARPGADRFERVPAADIIHLHLTDRWPQTRGEPWMHTVLRKFDELNEYSGLELSAARAAAAYFATITSPEQESALKTDEDPATGQQLMDIEPLMVQQLSPGEQLQFHTPNRPNTALDPFIRAMLRELAAGVGTSYESLSRDYSQSNYSSSRLALLDDRDLWRTLQQWWIRSLREPLHKVWLQQAVLAEAIDGLSVAQYAARPDKFAAVLFKPRGWSWVDPTKEVAAYKEAIRSNLTTITDVVAQTGGGMDIEDVIKTRKRELDMLKAAGIDVDTTVTAAAKAPPAKDPPPPPEEEDDDDTPARKLNLNLVSV